MPIIVTNRKPTYWKCGDGLWRSVPRWLKSSSGWICYFRHACDDHVSDWDRCKKPVGSNALSPFSGKATCVDVKGEWLAVRKTIRKLRTAGHQSQWVFTAKDIYNPTPRMKTRPSIQKQSGINVSSTSQVFFFFFKEFNTGEDGAECRGARRKSP